MMLEDSSRAQPQTHMTYYGNFVATRDAIVSHDRGVYERMRDSMSHGEHVEESHYAERIWVHLLLKEKPSAVRLAHLFWVSWWECFAIVTWREVLSCRRFMG